MGRRKALRRKFTLAVALLLSLAIVLAACGSDKASDDGGAASGASPKRDASPEPELVGTWERVTRCAEIEQAFKRAGLQTWIPEFVAGNNFVPGVRRPSQLTDPSDPCRGSVPRVHSHFFTDGGTFGSLDFNGDQVDDGVWETTAPQTFTVTKEFPDPMTFHYEIDGDSLMLEPVVPDCSPGCFEAAWSVVVAYPGKKWHRADAE
jgi:hypothetical protein